MKNPPAQDAQSTVKERTRARRLWRWFSGLLGTVLLLGLVLGGTAYWLWRSEPGTVLVLSALEKLGMVRIQGISGTLDHSLRIRHLELRGERFIMVADDLNLAWQPWQLRQGHLHLNLVRIDHLNLILAQTSGAPAKLPDSLVMPRFLREARIDQLLIHRFEFGVAQAIGQPPPQLQQFTNLDGALVLDATQGRFNLAGATEWGSAELNGHLNLQRPFALQSTLIWHGVPLIRHGLALPGTRVSALIGGSLDRVLLDAEVASEPAIIPKPSGTQTAARGRLHGVLTPFATLPLESFELTLSDLDPATLYPGAPDAALSVQAAFKAQRIGSRDDLSGHIVIHNSRPQAWNIGGLPTTEISTDLTLSDTSLSWHSGKLVFGQGGSALAEGEWKFSRTNLGVVSSAESVALAASASASASAASPVATEQPHTRSLPDIQATFKLHHVNAELIDRRLQKTSLDGVIELQPRGADLNMVLHLNESARFNTQIAAELVLNPALEIMLSNLELSSHEAILKGQGRLALQGSRQFQLTAEAHHFNPARWLAVPDGQIESRFNVSGQISQGWRVMARVDHLAGQFAGQALSGRADFRLQQDQLLDIQQLDLSWGRNHVSGQGQWQPGGMHQHLQFSVELPDLGAASKPLAALFATPLHGALRATGNISGSLARPSGQLTLQASQLAIPNLVKIDQLTAEIAMAEGEQGRLQGNLALHGLLIGAGQADPSSLTIQNLQARLEGQRHAHDLTATLNLPQQQQVDLMAHGDFQQTETSGTTTLRWEGQVRKLDVSGPLDFQLQHPFNLTLAPHSVRLEQAQWRGTLGNLSLQQLTWTPGQLDSTGQLRDIAVVSWLKFWLKFWHLDAALDGNLLLNADWQLRFGQQLHGSIQVQRASGDISLPDNAMVTGRLFALGLSKLNFNARLNEQGAIGLQWDATGKRLGQISARLDTSLQAGSTGWHLTQDAPVQGRAELKINDIGWMSQLLGPDISLDGSLQAQAQLGGTLNHPDWHASLTGRQLQIAFTELGILLPHGTLDAVIDNQQLTLNTLKFSQTIKAPPHHDELNDLDWLKQVGQFEATGSIDLSGERGSISARWQKFPLLQNPESWLVASGQAQLAQTAKIWQLTGLLTADAAYFSVPKQAAPRLSGDIIVIKKNAKLRAKSDAAQKKTSQTLQTSLDFRVAMGQKFIFVGRGLNTRLDGELRLRSQNDAPIMATGTIQTQGGSYEGYGQQLAIERGILNFQGPLDDPGLNVRAIRRGLPVEAGVEVVGTVSQPEVHLISEPTVPDPDKLSWMVLGRASDQMSGSESAALMTAASAIFGGEGGGLPANMARRLGLEGLTFGTIGNSPQSSLPVQTVAGTIASVPADQVFSVGKRISPNIVLSIERSLTDASNGLKLTWHLTRRFSIIVRAGNDTALDGQYIFSYD